MKYIGPIYFIFSSIFWSSNVADWENTSSERLNNPIYSAYKWYNWIKYPIITQTSWKNIESGIKWVPHKEIPGFNGCNIYIDPVFVNPSSRQSIMIVLLNYIGRKFCVVRYGGSRYWVIVVCDGLPHALVKYAVDQYFICTNCNLIGCFIKLVMATMKWICIKISMN